VVPLPSIPSVAISNFQIQWRENQISLTAMGSISYIHWFR
jgi:hypothetical protein